MRALKRLALCALGCLLLAGGSRAGAADVAVLKSNDVPAWRPALEALHRKAVGFTLTEYDFKGDRAEAERVVASLRGHTAAYVTFGPLAADVVRSVAPDAPLVFTMVADPARAGLLGVPNVTGVAITLPAKNQLAAFRMVNPRAVRIGVLYNPENSGRLIQDALRAMQIVRMNLVDRPISSDRDVPEALKALLKGNQAVDALWLPPDPAVLDEDVRRLILTEAARASRPIYASIATLPAEGALVACAPDFSSIGEEAAELLGRITGPEKGTRIEMLIPRAELIINKKAADKLKVDIPADALGVATKVL
jgi:putative ABC transport system substrate-binding protein